MSGYVAQLRFFVRALLCNGVKRQLACPTARITDTLSWIDFDLQDAHQKMIHCL